MAGLIKIPISGGPNSGKTTLFNSLREVFPNAFFVEEAATLLIKSELSKHNSDLNYLPIVPWINPKQFGEQVFAKYIELENELPKEEGLVFLDRCFIDVIGYSRSVGHHSRASKAKKMAIDADYTTALFCSPIDHYQTTEIRREDQQQAEVTSRYLWESYQEFEVPTILISMHKV